MMKKKGEFYWRKYKEYVYGVTEIAIVVITNEIAGVQDYNGHLWRGILMSFTNI